MRPTSGCAERERLTRLARRTQTSQVLALRAKIVLACAEGTENKAVAAELRTSEHNVARWRGRFVRQRLDGLHDEKRPAGRRPSCWTRSRRSSPPPWRSCPWARHTGHSPRWRAAAGCRSPRSGGSGAASTSGRTCSTASRSARTLVPARWPTRPQQSRLHCGRWPASGRRCRPRSTTSTPSSPRYHRRRPRSRYALSIIAHDHVTGPAVLQAFRAACEQHGAPASTLTDNGMVFTTRLSGGKGGRNALEHELRRLGITQENGKPNHPRPRGRSSGSSRP